MTQKKYNLFYSVMQRIAASPPGAYFFARTLHHFDRVFLRLSAGRVTMASLVSGLPVVVVTTTGAKSGLPRSVPLLCIRDERDPATFALIATNWGQQHYPAWYFNLKANPHASCSIAGKTEQYLAHEAAQAAHSRAEHSNYGNVSAKAVSGSVHSKPMGGPTRACSRPSFSLPAIAHGRRLAKRVSDKLLSCFRASPLTKKYGWGIYSNEEGKIAMYGVESEEYQRFVADESVIKGNAL
jgi:deazaflavin-dependent oxidoreductase (nitroreductase family)